MFLPFRVRALLLAAVLGAPSLAACSLTLGQDKNQCKIDADCAKRAGNLTCAAGICVARSGGGGGGAGGSEAGGTGGSDAAGTGGSEAAAGSSGAGGTSGGSGGSSAGSSGSGGEAGKAGAGGAPCSVPAPTCPDNLCLPFDNCTRLGLCDGAPLPALVAPSKP